MGPLPRTIQEIGLVQFARLLLEVDAAVLTLQRTKFSKRPVCSVSVAGDAFDLMGWTRLVEASW
jgi:hypothetical protein